MVQLKRIPLPAFAQSIVMSPNGLVYVGMAKNRWQDKTGTILCFDLDGVRLWEKQYPSMYPQSLKLDQSGDIWLASDTHLRKYDTTGNPIADYEIDWADYGAMGGFIVAQDGYYVCSRLQSYDFEGPSVRRYLSDGSLVWQSALPKGPSDRKRHKEYGWRPHPSGYDQPLTLSGPILIARYRNDISGVGQVYGLDSSTGQHRWSTPTQPTAPVAIATEGRFLIGSQGYGNFDTCLYDESGTVQHWSSSGFILITEAGEIRCVEMRNTSEPMHFCILKTDGVIRKGPHLSSYYTAYPVLDDNSAAVFWRDGKLLAVDRDLQLHVLYEDAGHMRFTSYSRILLFEGHKLVFGSGQELWIFDVDLAPMARSPWPCQFGNLEGNPVFQDG